MNRIRLTQGLAMGLGLATFGSAQVVVSSDITTSTHWTANHVYQLQNDIYVHPGATLTIDAGTVIASTLNSTLAICRGAQIIANGNVDNPIIFTSTNDYATWTAGNPKTGTYRQLATNEWGNLTIMGAAYISENQTVSNSPAPSSTNYADMEALSPANTSLNDYGGGNDNDDTGTIRYVSIRYGGRTAAVGVELNGMSVGGIGRGTDIDHVEIVNPLDDAVETWGGTVNYKYMVTWNAGDESFDIDQGWRGKAQFGLLVQGYCNTGLQGSGFGDNALEMDGAELCDYQPTTTAVIDNFTVIGGTPPVVGGVYQSNGTDHLTAWRDNCNMQFHNCIFMDAGDNVINNDISDFENGNTGYGCNGTLDFATRWTTSHSVTSPVNPFAAPEITPAQAYQSQVSGNLIEFRDNIFYNNLRPQTYTEANARNVFTGGGGSNNANNSIVATMPITALTREAAAAYSGNPALHADAFVFIDPTPASADALTSVEFAPNDGFFTPSRFRGGFARGNNWLIGWTAMSTWGKTTQSQANTYIAAERGGVVGAPVHYTTGTWASGTNVTLSVENMDPTFSLGLLIFGGLQINLPIFGGTVVPSPDAIFVVAGAGGAASFSPIFIPAGLSGLAFYTQFATFDVGVPNGEFAFSNAQRHILP